GIATAASAGTGAGTRRQAGVLREHAARLRRAATKTHVALRLLQLLRAAAQRHGLAVLVDGVAHAGPATLGPGAVLLAGALVAAVDQRLEGGDQVVLAVADQVGPAHAFQRLAQQRPVVGVVVAQEG